MKKVKIEAYIYNDSIEIKGHASSNFICSAVSASVLIISNLILQMELIKYVDIKIDTGYFKIKKKKIKNINIDNFFIVLQDAIEQLAEQYSDTVYIKKEEDN